MYKAVRWLLLQDCASDGLLMQTIASGRLSMQTIASETRGPSTGSHAPRYFLVLTLYTVNIFDVSQEATVALSATHCWPLHPPTLEPKIGQDACRLQRTSHNALVLCAMKQRGDFETK